jgi:hypothetical protein
MKERYIEFVYGLIKLSNIRYQLKWCLIKIIIISNEMIILVLLK